MVNLIPNWAPNIHPLLVHFPIVLLITASLADLLSLFWLKPVLRKVVLMIFFFGVIMLLATFLSGKQAINSVNLPLTAELTASHHADWALNTLIFYGIYFLARITIYFTGLGNKKWIAILLFLIGISGIGFIAKTADLGGKLVYGYGVGTSQENTK